MQFFYMLLDNFFLIETILFKTDIEKNNLHNRKGKNTSKKFI